MTLENVTQAAVEYARAEADAARAPLEKALDAERKRYTDHMALPGPAGHVVIPPPSPKACLFGASYGGADESQYKGRTKVARVFEDANLLADVTKTTGWGQAYEEGNRVFILSWKGTQTGAQVATCLKSVPADCTVYGSYLHEPEDNIRDKKITLDEWRSRHIEHQKAMRDVGVTPVGIFMQFSLTRGSGRNIMDYACGDDGVLLDFYMNNAKGKVNPEDAVKRMSAAAKDMGAKFCGTAETGVNMNGTPEAMAVDLAKRCRAAFIADPFMAVGTWWSTKEFKFTEATANAWFEGR